MINILWVPTKMSWVPLGISFVIIGKKKKRRKKRGESQTQMMSPVLDELHISLQWMPVGNTCKGFKFFQCEYLCNVHMTWEEERLNSEGSVV